MTRGKLLHHRADRLWTVLLLALSLLTILLLVHYSSSPPNVRAVSERPEVATASAAAARSMEQRADRITAALAGAVPAAGGATLDHCRSDRRPFGIPRYKRTYCVHELTRYLGFDGDFAGTGTAWDSALLDRHWTPSDGSWLDGNLRLTVQRVEGPAGLPDFQDPLDRAAADPGPTHVIRDRRPSSAEAAARSSAAAAEVLRAHRHLAVVHLSLSYYRD
ncbi:hypothetical protein ACGFX4_13170 [Kitasatospora sp. NPDC048365]|uniref:hypothetical protein n=1 Tax=Kitasatospora sp. NPDC048365 TaxID=3364050 RepID=UPI00371697CC